MGRALALAWIPFGLALDDSGRGVVALSLDSVWLSLPDDCGAVVALPSMIPGVAWSLALALAWSLCGRSLMIAGPCSR